MHCSVSKVEPLYNAINESLYYEFPKSKHFIELEINNISIMKEFRVSEI